MSTSVVSKKFTEDFACWFVKFPPLAKGGQGGFGPAGRSNPPQSPFSKRGASAVSAIEVFWMNFRARTLASSDLAACSSLLEHPEEGLAEGLGVARLPGGDGLVADLHGAWRCIVPLSA